MIRAASSALLVLAASLPAAAQPVAYVDDIVVAGGPAPVHARTFADASVRRAGMQARFAEPGAASCGDDGACLAERARTFGAAIALRLTIVEVGDRVVVSLLAADRRGTTRREVVPAADLDHENETIAATLRELAPPAPERARLAAWAALAGSAALAVGGGAAMLYAYDRRADFYADHVAANGDVFGISPADARAEERAARQWSIVGAVALGAAAVTGVAAAVLFVRDSTGEARPAGLAIAWSLP